MQKLPFDCYCSDLKVHPKNWLTPKASTKKDWYIYYRFYDPKFKDNIQYKKGKLILLKGMNSFNDLKERQSKTQKIIDAELDKLLNRSYNPIKGVEFECGQMLSEITPDAPLMVALRAVEKQISGSVSTKRDLKSILNFVSKAALILGYAELPINSISRKHFKQLLTQVDMTHGESAHRYNKIRTYLMMLYKELIELEVVETNPLRDISKKKIVQKLRKLPSQESRKIINDYLKSNQYRFWLFMQIFYHSGARLTELMLVKRKDVFIEKQSFKITIKKGSHYKEVMKPIKNIAVSFWKQALENSNPEDFIFSKGLIPGAIPIQSYQITKRWNRHIKKKLGIEEDFYSLKHLNLDETSSILGINDAAAMASHTSSNVTLKYYTINEVNRQNERLKAIDNSFT